MLAGMASLDSVMQKLYRAKHHFLELEQELRTYYTTQETVQIRQVEDGLNIGSGVSSSALRSYCR